MLKNIAMIALAISPTPSIAYTLEDGNSLNDICKVTGGSADSTISAAFCAGYIRAAFEQLWVDDVAKGNHPEKCVPSSLENAQIIELVKAYLRNNPTRRDTLGVVVVHMALHQAFPDCFS
jgi:hypothetical protein